MEPAIALQQLERKAGLLADQNRVLEQIARGYPLSEVLTTLTLLIEKHVKGLFSSVLLLDEDGKHLRTGAAPSLPDEYNRIIDGIEIGVSVGSCGTAAFRGERVVVVDTRIDPLWAKFQDLVKRFGLLACWSEPIFGANGRVTGTFAIYHGEPSSPTIEEIELIEMAASLAGIAIDRQRSEAEQRRLVAQIQHAQKLESLGLLAGGIAHDFNNLLVGILGNAGMALTEVPRGVPGHREIEAIEKAAIRAADLTQQLLAYSGKGQFQVAPIDLSVIVEEMTHLLLTGIDKGVSLQNHFAEELPAIEADATQIRQVIMNLITNANEAIGDRRGTITLTTGVKEVDRAYLINTVCDDALPEGSYVFLEVADTGEGMTEDTRRRIFDPFFSTKFTGRGLGLAAVLGIVRGHRGAIKVFSQPGRGTAVRVLFPSSKLQPRKSTRRVVVPQSWQGEGKILVVDDDETVRNVACRILDRAGFQTITAADGVDGVNAFVEHINSLVLVLLDMTMPGLDGEAAFDEIHRIAPEAKVILMSGYNELDTTRRFAGKPLAGFLQKPFRPSDLLDLVREVIESR